MAGFKIHTPGSVWLTAECFDKYKSQHGWLTGLLQNKTAENISSLRQKYFSEKCAVSGCCKTVISKEEWVDEEICCLTGNLGQQQRIC